MSQGDPAGAVPELEPRSGAGTDEEHKSQLLVREALSVIGAVVQTLMGLVADLQAWCAVLERRANEAVGIDAPPRRRELADHQDRLVAAESLLARARREREAAEELAVGVRRSAVEQGRARTRPGPSRTPVVDDGPGSGADEGSRVGAAIARLREFDLALESADEQLEAYDARAAAVRVLVEPGSEPGPADDTADAVTGSAATPKTADGHADGYSKDDRETDEADPPEDRKPPAPVWTTWCTVLTGCGLLLAAILAGTSFTYARWEHPGAEAVTWYAIGDLLALCVVVFVGLMVLGTLVERYELSTLGETSLVLAILLVVPVLGVGMWHPEAFGHMGMWGRSLARSLV
ncbi:hypothetical protein [Streptomyces sp. NPDC088910]|uniref:hypothetical protein n=1 Tax=Streptomyces sp. NPDC088910 TaxID=3365911 RepID=UPI003813B726